jgi:uncharacterized C2H2 Zn-finger protein
MTLFKCNLCSYTTTKCSNFNKHINTNKHLLNTGYSGVIQEGTNKNKKEQLRTIKNSDRIINNIIKCEYCESIFKVKKCLSRHLLKSCIKIPTEMKNKLIVKHNNNPKTKEHNKLELLPVYNNTNNVNNLSNVNNNYNNTVNNTINNIVNINIDNINNDNLVIKDGKKYLKILPLFKEDISHITHEDKLNIFNAKHNYYNAYQKKLYENPSNLNTSVLDKKEKMLQFLDEKDCDIYNDIKNSIISKIISSNMYNLCELYEDVHKDIPMPTHKIIDKEWEKYESDDAETMKRLKQMTYFKILEITSKSEEIINNLLEFEDGKKPKYILIGFDE